MYTQFMVILLSPNICIFKGMSIHEPNKESQHRAQSTTELGGNTVDGPFVVEQRARVSNC